MSLYNPFSLVGKHILITGASSGIGKTIAVECSKMGAAVVITGRDKKKLAATFSLLEPNSKHSSFAADLTKEEEIEELIQHLPKLSGVVNCAGILKKLPFKFTKREDLQELLDVNLIGPSVLLQKIYKKGMLLNEGSIVFISSIATHVASVGNVGYMASKGAVNSLVKGIALELSYKNVRVNCIEPALVLTNLSESALTPAELSAYEKQIPLGRFGRPEEIAFAAIYLLSDASSWTTGSIITIDGGITLR
jgi:NAD(P)-dependent dehydrogenase (short-subunit alcohol dehydrogenase family)